MGKRIILGFHKSPFVGERWHKVRWSDPYQSHTEFYYSPELPEKIRPDLDRVEQKCLTCGEVMSATTPAIQLYEHKGGNREQHRESVGNY